MYGRAYRVIAAAIADPTLQRRASCRRRAIYQKRELAVFVIFHHFFFNGSHAYISIFNTSIASLGRDEHIKKIRVSKSPILKFLWDFEICQNGPKVDVGCVSRSRSSRSHISVPPIFEDFLIEVESWNFGCVFGPPWSMRGFSIFWNRGPLKPPGALKPPPKVESFPGYLNTL